ncbi:MAG TPA: PAS domain S-box protein [Pirellulales bacterium]|nr:PAS domain S-box protein [Pirellulales bacterium]
MSKPLHVLSFIGSGANAGLRFADLRRSGFLELQIQRLPLAYVALDDQIRVLEWNPAAERTFGYSKEEALGRGALDLILPPPLDGQVVEILRRLRTGDMDAHSVNTNRTKGGRIITCQWFNTPLMDSEGRFLGAIALAQDITERTALEERLGQSQKLEAVGRFAAGIAHDLSGFATAINVCTHLLGEVVGHDNRARQLLNEISAVAARSTSLTRQLLAFSRQQNLAPRVISVNDVVRDAEEMLRRLMPKNVRFVTTLDPSVAPILADPGQLERVLFNLVVNGRDAMPGGGTLSITTHGLTSDELAGRGVAGLPPGRYAVLAVTDSGAGMSEETKQHIFEPFFSTKEPGRASGLGLCVVDGIIKQSRGHISVESQPGQGTCFRICLPCAAAHSVATD